MSTADAEVPPLLAFREDRGIPAGRRMLDILVAAIGLVCLAPLMLLIVLAIWAESGRPVLFSQIRLGEGARLFQLYKFRKFRADGSAGGAAVTLKHDCRLTRVGRFLVRTKLDELPQLWNVLNGDMSIVGPRPETLNFADCFGETYRAVLAFRPGIFGPNQAFLRNECALYQAGCDPEEFYRGVLFPLKARADLAYFPYRTMSRDIAWIARGVLAVFGCLSLPQERADLVEQVESWIRQSHLHNAARVARAMPR